MLILLDFCVFRFQSIDKLWQMKTKKENKNPNETNQKKS